MEHALLHVAALLADHDGAGKIGSPFAGVVIGDAIDEFEGSVAFDCAADGYRVESFGPAEVFQRLVGEKDMTAFVADRA